MHTLLSLFYRWLLNCYRGGECCTLVSRTPCSRVPSGLICNCNMSSSLDTLLHDLFYSFWVPDCGHATPGTQEEDRKRKLEKTKTKRKMAGVWRCTLTLTLLMFVCLWATTEAVGGAKSRPRPKRRPRKKPKVDTIDLTPPQKNIDIQQVRYMVKCQVGVENGGDCALMGCKKKYHPLNRLRAVIWWMSHMLLPLSLTFAH